MGNTQLRRFKADMHIHSCLSPCSDVEMSPRRIVEKSCDKGLDIIAICDHNSAENVEAALMVGKRKGLTVLPGMEVCSREEVHVVALFETLEHVLAMQAYVYAHMTEENQPELFGNQYIVNEKDELLGENSRLLIGATQLGLNEIVDKIHFFNGLSIASHIDRPAFGLVSQLGFIPADLKLDGIEVSRHTTPKEARKTIPGIGDIPCITSSDAHYLDDIGKVWTVFTLAVPTLEEIRLAFKSEDDRSIETFV